jgi:FkbM family methyltransferase
MNKTVITTKLRPHEIDLSDAEVKNWFDNSKLTQTDIILQQINEERLYDPILAQKENLVILDIGANVGLFSLYAQDSAKKIVAVEPTPRTFAMLNKLTQGVDKITPVAAALSAQDGDIDFFVTDNPTINSLLDKSIDINYDSGQSVTVKGKTIKTILDEQELDWVDFVKCDIEGGEVLALTVDTVTAVKGRIGSWFVEVHQTNRDQSAWPGNLESNRLKLIEIFKQSGYDAVPLINDQIFAWLNDE